MSAIEEIESAIDKLTKLWDTSTVGPWKEPDDQMGSECPEDRGWWILNADEHGMNQHAVAVTVPYNPTAAEDADLIVTLHRTIEAMHVMYVANGRESAWNEAVERAGDLDLARAINGTAS